MFPESLKLLWELTVPHVVGPQIDEGHLHPVLHFTCAEIVQERSPLLVFFQIFGDVFGEQNVTRVAAVHHPLRHVDSSTREIGPFIYIDNPADWPAVDSHTKLQARMFLERAADLHRAPRRRFRTGVKDQHHPVASRNLNQTVRGFGSLKLFGGANDPG